MKQFKVNMGMNTYIMGEFPKHKLTINLLKLSYSDDFENAVTEWELIFKEAKKDKKIQCICQRVIRHAYFFYNKQTKQTISVGSTCKNKFMKIEKELEHPILKVIFANALTKGQYKIINNVVEYALDNQIKVK